MPRQGEVEVPAKTVVPLTDGTVSEPLSFTHVGGREVRVLGTATNAQPAAADFKNGVPYRYGMGERGESVQDIFRGTDWTYLWVWSSGDAKMTVFHA